MSNIMLVKVALELASPNGNKLPKLSITFQIYAYVQVGVNLLVELIL